MQLKKKKEKKRVLLPKRGPWAWKFCIIFIDGQKPQNRWVECLPKVIWVIGKAAATIKENPKKIQSRFQWIVSTLISVCYIHKSAALYTPMPHRTQQKSSGVFAILTDNGLQRSAVKEKVITVAAGKHDRCSCRLADGLKSMWIKKRVKYEKEVSGLTVCVPLGLNNQMTVELVCWPSPCVLTFYCVTNGNI